MRSTICREFLSCSIGLSRLPDRHGLSLAQLNNLDGFLMSLQSTERIAITLGDLGHLLSIEAKILLSLLRLQHWPGRSEFNP
jgi:hypothetical protein